MEGWEVWLGRHGEPCGQPLAATDLETMRGNAFIERFRVPGAGPKCLTWIIRFNPHPNQRRQGVFSARLSPR